MTMITTSEKQITLTISTKDIHLILKGLDELPRKESNELFVRIDSDAYRQLVKPAEPVKPQEPVNENIEK